MTPLTDAELAEAKALDQAATPGPWVPGDSRIYPCSSPEDARFIAASRTLVHRLLATIDALKAEVERLKAENREDYTALVRAREGSNNYRDVYLAYQHWAGSRAARLMSLASSDAAYRTAIDAALEIDEPAEEPTYAETDIDALCCECCGQRIAAGQPIGFFVEDGKREIVMHWGPCPEPDLWRVTYVFNNLPTMSEGPLDAFEAYRRATHYRTLHNISSLRLVRIRRGGTP